MGLSSFAAVVRSLVNDGNFGMVGQWWIPLDRAIIRGAAVPMVSLLCFDTQADLPFLCHDRNIGCLGQEVQRGRGSRMRGRYSCEQHQRWNKRGEEESEREKGDRGRSLDPLIFAKHPLIYGDNLARSLDFYLQRRCSLDLLHGSLDFYSQKRRSFDFLHFSVRSLDFY